MRAAKINMRANSHAVEAVSSEAHQCAIASSLRLMGAPKGVIAPASTLAANALGLLRASPACVQIAEAAANKDDA